MPSEGQVIGLIAGWQPSVALHFSWPLQMLLSWQLASFGKWTQPTEAMQVSTVQETLSAQFNAVPAWQPSVALQVSMPLQRSPSLQSALTGVNEQAPVFGLQSSTVHGMLSLQTTGAPGTHFPPGTLVSHVSTPLQASPSLHWLLLVQFWTMQPLGGVPPEGEQI
jgi:hypothetical protein